LSIFDVERYARPYQPSHAKMNCSPCIPNAIVVIVQSSVSALAVAY